MKRLQCTGLFSLGRKVSAAVNSPTYTRNTSIRSIASISVLRSFPSHKHMSLIARTFAKAKKVKAKKSDSTTSESDDVALPEPRVIDE